MIFKQKYHDGSYVQIKVDQDATWREATDHFLQFLHACGYVFYSVEVGEYILEQWVFQKREKPDVLINGQEVSLPTKKGKRHAKKR